MAKTPSSRSNHSARAADDGGGPKRIGDIVGRVLGRYGFTPMTAQRELEEQWLAIAGPAVASRTRLGALRRGVLEVLVENAVLLQQLDSYHKETLLAGLQGVVRHSQITAIRFRRM